ncbi:hypothetical protein LPJ66_002657 [Kickxella alabastrina]|uniref:Uncharacterized protein n=1 Tax=Kickxella alabastrina TaxID=61397 RepID=A0ACC1IPT3_9FUNG|nr:hypothetical protein LPJ66_002657 [Kickxella alabastrina]
MSGHTPIKAVLFDIGGVVVRSPFVAISSFERENSLPPNYINVGICRQGSQGAFQKYERGELAHQDFLDLWTRELNDFEQSNSAYLSYVRRHGLDRHLVLPTVSGTSPGAPIGGSVLCARMVEVARSLIPETIALIRWLRSEGYRVGALTNSFGAEPVDARVRGLFGCFVESAAVGMRKPEEGIYLMACNLLDVRPRECVFVDDIAANLKAAASLGMAVVRVRVGAEMAAVEAVKAILNARAGAGAFSSAAKI